MMNEKEAIKRYYELVDKFSSGYFWRAFGNASQRASFAKKHALDFTGELAGKSLEIHFSVSPSRNNLYKKQSILWGGRRVQRKTIEKLINLPE